MEDLSADAALLKGLLEHYSPTDQESGAVEFLVEAMQTRGYSACVDPAGNAVGVLGDGPNEIILLGHIDTVPGYIEVRQEGDILHGRGAVDAKGPLACFVAAASKVKPLPGWRITVIGAVGEEGDSRGAKYLRENRQSPRMVVIGEPSGWDRITLGYKGSFWFYYSTRKALAHASGQVSSACETAVQFWNDLLALTASYNAPYARAFDQITPTLRGMSSSQDGFYENAQLKIGIRAPGSLTMDQLAEMVQGLANNGKIQAEDSIPPYKGEKNTPLVRAFLAAIRKFGGQPGFTLKTGTSDMNLVGPVWNCPILAYGPGDSNLDHTPEENIHISEYLTSIDVLAFAIEQVMRN